MTASGFTVCLRMDATMTFVPKLRTPSAANVSGASFVCPTNEKRLFTFLTLDFSYNSLCMKDSDTMTIRMPAGLSASKALSR